MKVAPEKHSSNPNCGFEHDLNINLPMHSIPIDPLKTNKEAQNCHFQEWKVRRPNVSAESQKESF